MPSKAETKAFEACMETGELSEADCRWKAIEATALERTPSSRPPD